MATQNVTQQRTKSMQVGYMLHARVIVAMATLLKIGRIERGLNIHSIEKDCFITYSSYFQ